MRTTILIAAACLLFVSTLPLAAAGPVEDTCTTTGVCLLPTETASQVQATVLNILSGGDDPGEEPLCPGC